MQPAVGPAGGVPQHPRVHVAENQVAGIGFLASSLDVVEDPLHLGSGEVGGQRQAGGRVISVLPTALPGKLVDDPVRPGVLPDDRVVHRLAGGAVPHDGGLALVGDTDCDDVLGDQVRLGQGCGADLTRVAPDLLGVVLDPAGPGEDLLVLALVDRDHIAGVIEDHAPGGGGSLVDCCYVLRHVCTPRVGTSRAVRAGSNAVHGPGVVSA